MTLLRNGSFEEWGEGDTLVLPVIGDPYLVTWDNVKVAAPWTPWYVHLEGTWDKPESKPVMSPERIQHGSVAACFFTFYRNHWGGHKQRVNVPVGATVRLSASAHAWSSTKIEGYESWNDNPHWSVGAGDQAFAALHSDLMPKTGHPYTDGLHNFHFRIGIDPTGNGDPLAATVVWSDDWAIYNEYHQIVTEATAQGGVVTVFLQSKTTWPFKHNDAYWDDVRLEVISEPEPPEPEPDCRGKPRVQYERTYNVIDPNATEDEAVDIFREGWRRGRETSGGSYDDAGGGDLDVRKVNLYGLTWADVPEFTAFYDEHYPGVDLTFILTNQPPEPEPEPEPPDPTYRNYMGLHLQTMVPDWDTYIERGKPTCAKAFSWNDVAGIKTRFPHLHVIGRHCTNNYGDTLENPDPAQGAKNWVDKFRGALYETCDRLAPLGLSTDEPWFYVESVNEVYPPTQRAATFDLAFIHELASTGLPIAPIVMTAAVGNPHESEFDLLLPLARACAAAKGAFGYHAYWYANANESGLVPYWQWLAGRWEEIDKVLVANGVRVKWFFGETGAVGGEFVPANSRFFQYRIDAEESYGPSEMVEGGGIIKPSYRWLRLTPLRDSGPTPSLRRLKQLAVAQDGGFILLPCDGWKSSQCYGGDFIRYLADQKTFNVMAANTDAGRRGDILGGAAFTSGIGVGWESFQLHGAEWQQMEALA